MGSIDAELLEPKTLEHIRSLRVVDKVTGDIHYSCGCVEAPATEGIWTCVFHEGMDYGIEITREGVPMTTSQEEPEPIPLAGAILDPDWAGAIEKALAVSAEKIELLTSAIQEPPTQAELADWLSTPPGDWPHTPTLAQWVALDAADPLLRDEVPQMVVDELLDDAVKVLLKLGVLTDPATG